MRFVTKAKGIHANFVTQCADCCCPITVTNGRPDPHTCDTLALADLAAALGRKSPESSGFSIE